MPPVQSHDPQNTPEPDTRCERCAAPEAKCLDGRWLCIECYYLGASCCRTFDDTDRWNHRDDKVLGDNTAD